MTADTPLRIRQQRTRQAILDATLDMVRTRGIDKVSWRGIARAVDYSPSGLYEYFASKDEIIHTLAAEGMAILDEYLAAVDNSAALEDQLVEVGLAYIRFAHDHPVRFNLSFSLLPSQRQSLEQAPAGAYERLYDLMQRGLGEGRFRPISEDGADVLAYVFWSLLHGMASLQITHLRDFDADFAPIDRGGIQALVQGLTC